MIALLLRYQSKTQTVNILIINGHPDPHSFNQSIFDTYKQSAHEAGHDTDSIELHQLQFTPNLRYGYRQRTELEPDLLEAWQKIQHADHLVWIYPVWWGSMPALLKGFIDRLFLPGMAFRYKPDSIWWDKLLKGKTAEIINTLDTPVWYYKWVLHEYGTRVMRRAVLGFCGIKTVRTTYIAPVRKSEEIFRTKALERIKKLPKRLKF